MQFKRSFFIIIPLLIPNISVNIMFLINFIFLFMTNKFQRIKINLYLLLFTLCFLAYGLVTFAFTHELSILRVLTLMICVPILFQINERHFTIIIWYAAIFTTFVIFFEMVFPNSSARLLYRSSLAKYHIVRESGLFLYPGDLGHFGVVVIAWSLRPKQRELSKYRNILLLLGLTFVFASESRLALLQVFAFLMFYLRLRGVHLFVLSGLSFLCIIYMFGLVYFHSILTILTDLDYLLKLKRVQEWAYLVDSVSLFGQVVNSSDHSFFESSVVGMLLRLGLLGSLQVFLILYWSTRVHILNKPYVASIVVTSLLGAPLERPELFIFSIRCLVVRKKGECL